MRFSYPPQAMDLKRGDDLKTREGRGSARLGRWTAAALYGGCSRQPRHSRAITRRGFRRHRGESESDAGVAARIGRALSRRHRARAVRHCVCCCARRGAASTNDPLRRVLSLDGDFLALQGPPGSGKTRTGARMILALVEKGFRVGITAVSHKVIRNLLDEVRAAAVLESRTIRIGQKPKERSPEPTRGIEEEPDNKKFAQRLGPALGTWPAPPLGSGRAARRAIQSTPCSSTRQARCRWRRPWPRRPQRATWFSSATRSSWTSRRRRSTPMASTSPLSPTSSMAKPRCRATAASSSPRPGGSAPSICELTSELFYRGKLKPREGAGLERQLLSGTDGLDGAGLWWRPVEHQGHSTHVTARRSKPSRTGRSSASTGRDLARSPRREPPPAWRRRARGGALQRPRHPARRTPPRPGSESRDGRQVPGTGGAGGDLHHGGVERRRRPARHGVPVQPEPLQRRDLARPLRGDPRRFARDFSKPSASTPRQLRLANALCRFVELAKRVGV